VSDLARDLAELGRRCGAVAGLILETTGIEVASWGEAEFETAAAEFAGIWREASTTDTASAAGGVRALTVEGNLGAWVAVPLGTEYVLGLMAGPNVPVGRLRFYAGEWARDHREQFA